MQLLRDNCRYLCWYVFIVKTAGERGETFLLLVNTTSFLQKQILAGWWACLTRPSMQAVAEYNPVRTMDLSSVLGN